MSPNVSGLEQQTFFPLRGAAGRFFWAGLASLGPSGLGWPRAHVRGWLSDSWVPGDLAMSLLPPSRLTPDTQEQNGRGTRFQPRVTSTFWGSVCVPLAKIPVAKASPTTRRVYIQRVET